MMVEAGSTPNGLRLIAEGDSPSDEATVARGLDEAKAYIGESIDLQNELVSQIEKPEADWPLAIDYSEDIYNRVKEVAGPRLESVVTIADKKERNQAQDAAEADAFAGLGLADDDDEGKGQAKRAFKSVLKDMMRRRVVEDGIRLDGRGATDIRAISAEVGVVGRTHGSGLFQRGETQVLNLTTLGMLKMEQMLDTLALEDSKRYMHHYNFPPFSTGEAGFMRGPKRREIGHGALAEKAVLPVIPTEEEFPYALRLVSEVLSSNGSTSMASVCASSLSLMDAGVPISAPVAGIAMGLIYRDGKYVTLTDILGAEDALGDMDFKVAGTRDVITALQLDTKIEGLPSEVLTTALDQARDRAPVHPGQDGRGDFRASDRDERVCSSHRVDRDPQGQDRRGHRSQGRRDPRARGSDGSRHRDRRDRWQGHREDRLQRQFGSGRSQGEGDADRLPAGGRVGHRVRRQGGEHHQVRRIRQHPPRA